MLRKSFALLVGCVVVTTVSASAFGALIGTATKIKDPSAGTAFGSGGAGTADATLGAPWVSYKLSLSATGADTLQAVDVALGGNFQQRWSSSNSDSTYDTATPNSTNAANADTHLMAAASAIIGAPATEDNTFAGSPLSANNGTDFGYGIGHSLTGAWSVNGAAVTALDIAYIVIKPSDIPNMTISVTGADPTGTKFPTLHLSDFGLGGGTGIAPTVVDGLINNVQSNDLNPLNNPVKFTFTTSAGDAPITWSNFGFDSFTQGFGGPAAGTPGVAATFDPATQAFSWLSNNTPRGIYKWHVTATNATGSDVGLLTVNVTAVPEPASLTLIGLAALGFVGFVGRRS
jgi:hypothetical protein